jgi:Fe-S-cluster-containing dehydrogenase component
MQYGFVIDHRRCIGCHACTVACKAENDVPVGSFRTWVKYVEKGRFPEVRRHFAVLRCNHCTNAPCVTICPVNALEKRKDGIVDIDRDVCIGCRACMQACPYDAIFLNEDDGCVEKCHYCAHRVERGLEPACVIVCPEQAIVSGDLHDPGSRIAQMVAQHPTLKRREEQETGPNVHYLGVEPLALVPGAVERPPTYLWSDRPPWKGEAWPRELPVAPDARVTLDAGHKVEWGAGVAAYLVTKGIAAGAAILAVLAPLLGLGSVSGRDWTPGLAGFTANFLPEIAALFFTLVTTFLLVEDLARPRLFLTLLTRGNRKSWLVKGAWFLIAFSLTVSATLALQWLRWRGDAGFREATRWVAEYLRWGSCVLAVFVAGYTAFLFQQCEGRDLWQSRLLLPHLIAQALLCGGALLLPFAAERGPLQLVVIVATAAHLCFALVERWGRHSTSNARQAAAFLGTVRLAGIPAFRVSLVLFAVVLIPLLHGSAATLWLAPAVAFAALYLYEWAYVRAAQLPPLS